MPLVSAVCQWKRHRLVGAGTGGRREWGRPSEERTQATTLGLTGTAVQNVCVSHLCDKQTGTRLHEKNSSCSVPAAPRSNGLPEGTEPPEKGVFYTVAAHDSRWPTPKWRLKSTRATPARSCTIATISLPALSAGDDIECGVVQEPPHPPNVGLPDDDMAAKGRSSSVSTASSRRLRPTPTVRLEPP